MSFFVPLLVGTATGVLSAFGVGGGSLLLIYLTSFASVGQQTAQGINLLYFLPAALAALPSHRKNGLLKGDVILPAIVVGLVTAGLAAWISNGLETAFLRKLYGIFLLYIGLHELFRKE